MTASHFPIKLHRLLLAIALTFFIADLAPHPRLGSSSLAIVWAEIHEQVQATQVGD